MKEKKYLLNEILTKDSLAPAITRMTLHQPFIAAKAKPGQFIILRVDEEGERIPLTLAGIDTKEGTVAIIFQEVGTTTKKLGSLKEGDRVENVLGPLGKPVEIGSYGNVLFVTGGVGSAFVYWMAKAFKDAGNTIYAIMGARNKELIILEKEMRELTEHLIITTDDGTKGRKGFVTDALNDLLAGDEKIGLAICAGPVPMMKFVSKITKEHHIPTLASLNPIMIDGTGMCGGCRVTVGDKVKFACVDGPDFDAHKIDFDELIQRISFFKKEEACSLEEHSPDCWRKAKMPT
ncbi:MAG: sulfide/dihydroorotate dehydrogenase-like FAD/NAD-binding protein [Candidatus Ratteibacteria bacterium]